MIELLVSLFLVSMFFTLGTIIQTLNGFALILAVFSSLAIGTLLTILTTFAVLKHQGKI